MELSLQVFCKVLCVSVCDWLRFWSERASNPEEPCLQYIDRNAPGCVVLWGERRKRFEFCSEQLTKLCGADLATTCFFLVLFKRMENA